MIDRKANPHIAFGRGPHICMGLHLARMEMRALLSELLRRTEQIAPVGRPRHVQSAFMGGVGALPVRLVFRSARG
jgi:cytochrome P450